MSWRKIKTFLIVLFALINIYLVYVTGSDNIIKLDYKTKFDSSTINTAISVINKNFDISINPDIIPEAYINLKNIDVTNYMYTDEFSSAKYNLKREETKFVCEIITSTFSYNEKNATQEIVGILRELGIDESTYRVSFAKGDTGLICYIREYISDYPILNGVIVAEFTSLTVKLSGNWYFPQQKSIESDNKSAKLCNITGIIIDTASRIRSDNIDAKSIVKIDYGYFVSYYEENAVSKSASAIPCYMVESDVGSKYYYDAYNGKFLKQED